MHGKKTINILRCSVSKTINILRCKVSKTINILRSTVSKTSKLKINVSQHVGRNWPSVYLKLNDK